MENCDQSQTFQNFDIPCVSGPKTFQNTFSTNLLSILYEFLTIDEILKISALSKDQNETHVQLTKIPLIWTCQFVHEFASKDDQITNLLKIRKTGKIDVFHKFLKRFPDLKLEDGNIYLLFTKCYQKQLKMRILVKKVVFAQKIGKRYFRPFENRRNFDLKTYGYEYKEGMPFELYVYWRSFYYEEFEGLNFETYKVLSDFSNEFVIDRRMDAQGHQLQYGLLHPLSAKLCSTWVRQFTASESDYLPLILNMGYRQSVFCDWTNGFGRGHTAIFLSCPNRQYFQYLAPSWEHFLEIHTYMRQFESNDDKQSWFQLLHNFENTKIHNMMNPDKISYEDIREPNYYVSINYQDGILLSAQANFELLWSQIFPANYAVKSEYHFDITIFVCPAENFKKCGKTYELTSFDFELENRKTGIIKKGHQRRQSYMEPYILDGRKKDIEIKFAV